MTAHPEKLLDRAVADVAALKQQWIDAGSAWVNHTHCDGCAFKQVHRERVGFFPNVAEQITSVCVLGQDGERPNQCPALVAERHIESELV